MHIQDNLHVDLFVVVWSILTQRDNNLILLAAGNSKIRNFYFRMLP